MSGNGAFIRNIPFSLDVDLNNDGKMESVSVEGIPNKKGEGPTYGGIEVKCDDKSCRVMDIECFKHENILIHTSDGRKYVYVFIEGYNGYSRMYVFDLNGSGVKNNGYIDVKEPIVYFEKNEGSASRMLDTREYPIVNPARFYLEKWVNALSTYGIKQIYAVGADGVPETSEEFGDVLEDITLTVKQSFKVKTVDISTNELKDNVVADKGEKLKIYRANGKDTVIFLKEDGSYVGVLYTGHDYNDIKVNGIPVEELFEELYYAG